MKNRQHRMSLMHAMLALLRNDRLPGVQRQILLLL
jgi:hypothetical protein